MTSLGCELEEGSGPSGVIALALFVGNSLETCSMFVGVVACTLQFGCCLLRAVVWSILEPVTAQAASFPARSPSVS